MCFDPGARPPIDEVAGTPIATEVLTLTADGAQFAAYLAAPREVSAIGIVILPDIRGLHQYYEELAVRFAERGYHAIAIDYFGRTAGVGHGDAREQDFDWQTHFAQTKADQIKQDTAAAIEKLKSLGATKLFTVGFCFGGRTSWHQAANGFGLAGAVGFYGRTVGLTPDGSPAPIDRVNEYTAPLLGLFGGADASIPQASIDAFDDALTAAGKPHAFTTYAGAPHSFFDRRFGEHQEACKDACERILAFIAENS